MIGILFAITALLSAYLADVLAAHWGFRGDQAILRTPVRPRQSWLRSVSRRTSSRLKGQPISPLRVRSTGMRSP